MSGEIERFDIFLLSGAESLLWLPEADQVIAAANRQPVALRADRQAIQRSIRGKGAHNPFGPDFTQADAVAICHSQLAAIRRESNRRHGKGASNHQT